MKVTIFGTGYVGLVQAAVLAEVGHQVCCVDVDDERIAALRLGQLPFYEPGLAPLVEIHLASGRLSFTVDPAIAVAHADLLLIAVGTPADEDGSADLQHVLAVADTIGRLMSSPKLVVTKSTVPVGTTQQVREHIEQQLAMRGLTLACEVAANPEFLKEGAAVNDCMRPDRIIIGCDSERALEQLRALYAPFNRNHDRIVVMDLRSAELTKYAANAMLATKISFMNEMAALAEQLGADIEAVRQGMGSDPRIGYHFIYPGCGYGGSCFPKVAPYRGECRLRRPAFSGGRAGQPAPATEDGANPEDLLRAGSARPHLRPVGAGVQTRHRRHARCAEPPAAGRHLGCRWPGAGL